MNAFRRCTQLLDRNRVPYTHSRHANAYRALEVAAAEHTAPNKVAKTVVLCADRFYAMALVPADCTLDLDALAGRIGVQRLRLATESEIVKLFPDSEVGAMPPFGSLFDVPVYMDERLAREDRIAFNAGTHRDVIHMRTEDYMAVAQPLVENFACPNVCAARI
jgi:Ala-tRNA(Pro) deacylase